MSVCMQAVKEHVADFPLSHPLLLLHDSLVDAGGNLITRKIRRLLEENIECLMESDG